MSSELLPLNNYTYPSVSKIRNNFKAEAPTGILASLVNPSRKNTTCGARSGCSSRVVFSKTLQNPQLDAEMMKNTARSL